MYRRKQKGGNVNRPWDGTSTWLPLPLLIIGIRPPILLTSNCSTEIRAVRIIKRVRFIINPFSNRKVTSLARFSIVLDDVNIIRFNQKPNIILWVQKR